MDVHAIEADPEATAAAAAVPASAPQAGSAEAAAGTVGAAGEAPTDATPQAQARPGENGVVATNGNGGFVPTWLQSHQALTGDLATGGFVPTWLQVGEAALQASSSAVHAPNGNPGVVPSWEQSPDAPAPTDAAAAAAAAANASASAAGAGAPSTDAPSADAPSTRAANGNPGTVPAWLQQPGMAAPTGDAGTPGAATGGVPAGGTPTDASAAPIDTRLQAGAWAGHDLAEVDAARDSLNSAVASLRGESAAPELAATYAGDAATALDRVEHVAVDKDGAAARAAREVAPQVHELVTATQALPATATPEVAAPVAARYDGVLDTLERVLGDVGWE